MADIHDLVAPYALDALDPDEIREFEAHLETCRQCQADLVELREGAASVAQSVSVTPPPRVKASVMDAIAQSPPPVVRLPRRLAGGWLAAAAAAAVAIVFAGLWMASNSRLDEAELIASVYEAPDASVVDLSTTQGPVRFVYSPSLQRGVFNGGSLRNVGEADLYQLWLIDEQGPASAGTFQPGDTDVLVDGARPGLILAMTVETSPGVEAPTGEPLFTQDL